MVVSQGSLSQQSAVLEYSARTARPADKNSKNQLVSKNRLAFIDALRGIAALGVAWFHFYAMSPLRGVLAPVLPHIVDFVLSYGARGVDIFFVLSGFVISLSIDGHRVTGRFVARFALRRSLRLDPAYWTVLAIATALLLIAHRPVSAPQVAAHVVYLQGILEYPQIVSMFWTLCYEIQFYLVFVTMVSFSQRTGSARVAWGFALTSVAASLILLLLQQPTHGVFLDWWYEFAVGVATYGVLTKRLPVWGWSLLLGSTLLAGWNSDGHAVVAVVAALVIAGVAWRGHLDNWTLGPIVQYLGRISYSLYLIHFVGNTITKYGGARHPTPWGAVGWFGLATLMSIAAAHILYTLVERPTHRLSRAVASLWI